MGGWYGGWVVLSPVQHENHPLNLVRQIYSKGGGRRLVTVVQFPYFSALISPLHFI